MNEKVNISDAKTCRVNDWRTGQVLIEVLQDGPLSDISLEHSGTRDRVRDVTL